MDAHDMEVALGGLETIRKLFDEVDLDSSGTLDADELAVVVRQYYSKEGRSRSAKAVQREVADALDKHDADGSGALSFTEFLAMMASDSFNLPFSKSAQQKFKSHAAAEAEQHENQAHNARDTLSALFQAADADGSGALDTDELTTVVKRYYGAEGKSRSAKAVQREVGEAMSSYDTDGNGVLCWEEFLAMAVTSSSFNFGLSDEAKVLLRCELQREQGAAAEGGSSVEQKRQEMLDLKQSMVTEAK